LDSHQKKFADECAICFSEILHNFRVPDLAIKQDIPDDVASCGTAESDDSEHGQMGFPRDEPPVFTPEQGTLRTGDGLGDGDGYDIVHGCGMSSAAESCGATTPRGGADDKVTNPGPSQAPVQALEQFEECEPVVLEDAPERDADLESAIRVDDGRHPDVIADEIMLQPPHLCNKEQLEFLYKTCRWLHLLSFMDIACADFPTGVSALKFMHVSKLMTDGRMLR
jgi:hypothetical protein